MVSLTVRDLPEKTVLTLKSRAARNNRSLNGEILSIFKYVASFGTDFDFPVAARDNALEDDGDDPILALAGKWKDDRPLAETIDEIVSSRTAGREVSL